MQSIVAPGGQTLSYTFDGFLTTGLVRSGVVAGNVGRVLNDNFKITSETINGMRVDFYNLRPDFGPLVQHSISGRARRHGLNAGGFSQQ